MTRKYVPALAYNILTPLFDLSAVLMGFGRPFKAKVLETAGACDRECILDAGCGSATLLIEAGIRCSHARILGLDADDRMLRLASSKLQRTGTEAELVRGFSQNLPFASCTFDLIASTMLFHHLPTQVKKESIREIRRVLKDNGRFILADFGKSEKIYVRALLTALSFFDGIGNMSANLEGRIPVLLEEAGFEVEEHSIDHRGKRVDRYHGVQFLLARKSRVSTRSQEGPS